MKTSASKIETFDLCKRKWWFTFVQRLPTITKDFFSFGTVLHAACERYLLSEPLWPQGWEIDPDTQTRVSPQDASLIQVLVQAGIDEGIVEKRVGGKVEEWITLKIDNDSELRGLIDYHDSQSRIEDHKTSKSTRYFKSPNALKKSIQMMAYAKWMLEELKRRGKVPPKVLTLVHNQFLKDYDTPTVRRREAEVTPAQVDKFFEEVIRKLVTQMKATEKITEPFAIEDPMPSACRAYGGCDFIPICTAQETMVQYERRITTINHRLKNPKPHITAATMTPEEFLAKSAAKKAHTPAVLTPINPPRTQAVLEVTDIEPGEIPPWADPNCPLCSKGDSPGFNPRKGAPCRICLSKTKVSTDSFEWEVNEGRLIWWVKGQDKPVAEQEAPEVVSAGSKTAYSVDAFLAKIKAAKDAKTVADVLVEAGEVLDDTDVGVLEDVAEAVMLRLSEPLVEEEEEEEAPAAATKRPRRTKAEMAAAQKAAEDSAPTPTPTPTPLVVGEAPVAEPSGEGPILLIGCSAIKWPGKAMVMAETILNGVEGYWSMPKVFERREAVRKAMSSGGFKHLNGMVIVQLGRDPDIDNLMSSMVDMASAIIRGSIQ